MLGSTSNRISCTFLNSYCSFAGYLYDKSYCSSFNGQSNHSTMRNDLQNLLAYKGTASFCLLLRFAPDVGAGMIIF